jgi:hypothetical protein
MWPVMAAAAWHGGLAQTVRQRQQATGSPAERVPLSVRLDVFHTQREGERAVRREWQTAEAHGEKAEAVERARARVGRRGKDRRGFNRRLARAWQRAVAAFAVAEGRAQAWRRALAALAVFRPDGQLNDRTWAAAELHAVAAALPGPRWAKTRRMLHDERSLTFLDRLHEELAVAEPRPEVRAALVTCWRRRRTGTPPGKRAASAWEVVRPMLDRCVQRQLGAGGEEAYRRVGRVLRRVVRASSAVECVNRIVRMHQARHRHLTQPLLDLKRLYGNARPFVWGQRRKHSPYQLLGLDLPSYDPWMLVQMDLEELQQKLSTQGLAA